MTPLQAAIRARRKAAMVAEVQAGMVLRDVAALHGVSYQYVQQLFKAETGLSVRAVRPPLGPRPTRDKQANRIRRFWARVRVEETGCWFWTGTKNPVTGYGHVRNIAATNLPHRLAYEAIRGAIPEGLQIDHLCRNRLCVNPDHLEAVTSRVNVLRSPIARAAINARKTHCIRGHEFTPENTHRRMARNGHLHRSCRACRRRNVVPPEQAEAVA